MCACKLKRGLWQLKVGAGPGQPWQASQQPSDNDKRAISGTQHEFLLLRGLSRAAQENSAVSWNTVLVVHSAGQGQECALSQDLLLFLFPCVISSERRDVWKCLEIQLILLNGPCWQGSPHPAFLAVPIILPPWWELAFHLNTYWAWWGIKPSFPQK